MTFKFSKNSMTRLNLSHNGIRLNDDLKMICYNALAMSDTDFGISETVRTVKRQEQLVKAGKSKTMKSKHLVGMAVDVVPWSPEIEDYTFEKEYFFSIAEAFRMAAANYDVKLRWGGAWHCYSITEYDKSMESLHEEYIQLRKSEGKKPFVDMPHFEIMGFNSDPLD